MKGSMFFFSVPVFLFSCQSPAPEYPLYGGHGGTKFEEIHTVKPAKMKKIKRVVKKRTVVNPS